MAMAKNHDTLLKSWHSLWLWLSCNRNNEARKHNIQNQIQINYSTTASLLKVIHLQLLFEPGN